MKIFVTGRQGQVARSLQEAVLPSGVTLVAAGRPEFDLCDAASVAATIARHQPDVVINAAAYTQVDKAESEEAAAFAVNADGAAHVARACAERDIPLIHLSTDFVFDGGMDRPYRETDRASPINAYGRSKLEGERRVAAICPKHLIVRTSWVYSPWGSNFVLTMLRLAKDRSVIFVVDDQHGNPTYAPHLADALIVLAQRAAAASPHSGTWGIYHAAGQGETTWCGFARAIFVEAAARGLPVADIWPISAAQYAGPAKRPLNSRLDCRKLRASFDIGLLQWQAGARFCLDALFSNKPLMSIAQSLERPE